MNRASTLLGRTCTRKFFVHSSAGRPEGVARRGRLLAGAAHEAGGQLEGATREAGHSQANGSNSEQASASAGDEADVPVKENNKNLAERAKG